MFRSQMKIFEGIYGSSRKNIGLSPSSCGVASLSMHATMKIKHVPFSTIGPDRCSSSGKKSNTYVTYCCSQLYTVLHQLSCVFNCKPFGMGCSGLRCFQKPTLVRFGFGMKGASTCLFIDLSHHLHKLLRMNKK